VLQGADVKYAIVLSCIGGHADYIVWDGVTGGTNMTTYDGGEAWDSASYGVYFGAWSPAIADFLFKVEG
jgi:hypothetical protein